MTNKEWPCPRCGQLRALKRKPKPDTICFRCSQTAKAKLGWKAVCEKRGRNYAIKLCQKYRLQKPSSLELRMMQILDEAQISYSREVIIKKQNKHWLVDFYVENAVYVEVNGEWVHSLHRQRDEEKARSIHGLIVVWESEMANPERVVERIRNEIDRRTARRRRVG